MTRSGKEEWKRSARLCDAQLWNYTNNILREISCESRCVIYKDISNASRGLLTVVGEADIRISYDKYIYMRCSKDEWLSDRPCCGRVSLGAQTRAKLRANAMPGDWDGISWQCSTLLHPHPLPSSLAKYQEAVGRCWMILPSLRRGTRYTGTFS